MGALDKAHRPRDAAEPFPVCLRRPVVMVPDPQLDAAEAAQADEVLTSLEEFRPERWGIPAFTHDELKAPNTMT